MRDSRMKTASEMASEITLGRMSAVQCAEACLRRVAAVEDEIQAFAHLDADHVLAQARLLDQQRVGGAPLGLLHGIPIALKDTVNTADYPTEYGSALFAGRKPRSDAAVVRTLRKRGAVIFGKTVTTELGLFRAGKTRNPRDLSRTPGGSSSGSAAAIASGMVPLAIGAQTIGSIIRPASYCGTFAIKPSYGLLAREGVLSASSSFDHVGAFARSLEDLAFLLDALVEGPVAKPSFLSTLATRPSVLPRFAFVRTPMWSRADPEARAAIEGFAAAAGATTMTLADEFSSALRCMRTVFAADVAATLSPMVHESAISGLLQDLIKEGRCVTVAQYKAALADTKQYAGQLAALFENTDAIIALSATGVAPKGLDDTGDPVFCALWTLAGLPSLNLPLLAGAGGLPIGVQLIGARNQDARLMQSARVLIEKTSIERPHSQSR